jgi:(1->4)-alpha-D-glucan 1-alpha-D-glucosylmutase
MRAEPIATYRLQFGPGFGFDEAVEVIPYLAGLGVSHVYTSPYLQATRGSTHGYDIMDPTRVNEELGGEEGLARFRGVLRSYGLEEMIDVVPNHLAVEGGHNPWWWDVLENGPSSLYAEYFDLDWEAFGDRWPDKLLLPVLADHYGRVLEDGRLRISYRDGTFVLGYEDQVFPLDPSSLTPVLKKAAQTCGSPHLDFVADGYARLPSPRTYGRDWLERREIVRRAVAVRARDKTVLGDLLSRLYDIEPSTRAAIEVELDRTNHAPDELDAIIEQQHYRLARWRMASRALDYRRFFDISGLAGVRTEEPQVFRSTHALPLGWVREGSVQGLRIDHPDGLREPTEYFRRLREACPDAWIVAEKILEADESLPAEWPIAGTTGYEFLNLVNGLFVDPGGESALTSTYSGLTGQTTDFADLVLECKRLVLDRILASEVNRLADVFVRVCERHRRHRDYTRYELKEALIETAVYFPVYRSYVSALTGTATPADEARVTRAVEDARVARTDIDPDLLGFLENLLLLRIPGAWEAELAMRFQQLTGPAMAKGLEDTALYRYHRLGALNEVGGDPGRFGTTIRQFHDACIAAQREHPSALLASSTHDTKRSEDVRGRLAILSEIPGQWDVTVRSWIEHNERHRRGDAPDRNTEYLFYQTLVGAWPIEPPRMAAYMEKAVREAKTHSSWTDPDTAYEQDLRDLVAAVMSDQAFCDSVESFVSGLVYAGRVNGLAQTLIKLTAPGVPDIYQGTEVWDLSLVDPDNRRPVDFALRRGLLAEAEHLSTEEVLVRMDEGLPKLWLIQRVLRFRRERPDCLSPASGYLPLATRGARSDNVVAFMRGGGAITVAPRLVTSMGGDWGDTVLDLPPGEWQELLTAARVTGDRVELGELMARFPVALLVRQQ